MRFQIPKDTPINTVRETRHFAILPTRVKDQIIWLEHYYIVEHYAMNPDTFSRNGSATFYNLGIFPKWIEHDRYIAITGQNKLEKI